MRAELYPIVDCPVGRLAIMPRPRAGDWLEDEARSWRRQGLDVVVSLLEDAEVAELGLADEARACEHAGLRFIRFPVPDRGVPASESAATDLVVSLTEELRAGGGRRRPLPHRGRPLGVPGGVSAGSAGGCGGSGVGVGAAGAQAVGAGYPGAARVGCRVVRRPRVTPRRAEASTSRGVVSS